MDAAKQLDVPVGEFLRLLQADQDEVIQWRVNCLDQENGLQWLVRMYGSLVTFRINLPERRLERLWQLCDERLIWTTRNPRLRMSTHIHTRREDLDLFFETLDEASTA